MREERRATPVEQTRHESLPLHEALERAAEKHERDDSELALEVFELGARARRGGISATALLTELRLFSDAARDRLPFPERHDVEHDVVRATIRGYWSAARSGGLSRTP